MKTDDDAARARSALCRAIGARDLPAVRDLLASGLEMDLGGPLAIALGPKPDLRIVDAVLEAGAEPTEVHDPPGARTCRMIAFDTCREALVKLRRFRQQNIIDAAIDGDAEGVRRFLADGASPDQTDMYRLQFPLNCAARLGHHEVIDVLLEAGAKLQPRKAPWHSPLLAALVGDHLECANRLAEAGCSPAGLLDLAVRGRASLPALAWWLDRGPRAELPRALNVAIRWRREDAVRWLIARLDDIDARVGGETFLMTAAYVRFEPAVDALLAAGIDAHATDASGQTALHYAIVRGEIYDPDEPFDYVPAALDKPVARKLIALGLPIPPRA